MLKNIILDKEKSLLEHKTRSSEAYLQTILADDFFEFGSSGKKHTKEDVLAWLVNEKPFTFKISDFNIQKLATTVVLATYQIQLNNSYSLRSSLWVLQGDHWQLKFHQGTSA